MILRTTAATTAGLLAALTLGAGCNIQIQQQVGDTGGDDVSPFSFSLRVARHTDQNFSQNRVDNILADASTILQNVDFECPDVACPVTFSRDGDIEVFDIGSPVVTTETQLDNIFNHPADVKVVTSMIGVCGTFRPGDLAVVIGCAYTGGSAVLTQDAPTDVWAHEWGHVQGLPHRDDCATNLMHTYELQTNAVNTTERNAFVSPTPSSGFFRTTPPSESARLWQSPRSDGESLEKWTEATLSRRYLAGVPSAAFDDADPEALGDILLDMFAEKPTGHRRLNVIRALGLVAPDDAGSVLSAFLEELNSPLSDDEVRAAAEAFLALGRIADRDDTGTALGYLIQATSQNTWAERGLSTAGGADAAELFARFAIMSLGIVEAPAALDHLLTLDEATRSGRLLGPDISDQIAEAIARSTHDTTTLRVIERSNRLP